MRGFFAIGFALLLASCASTPSLTPQRGVALSPLLEMQLEGTREAPVPPAVLRFQLQHPGHAPAPSSSRVGAKIGLWASDTNFNYLLGQDSSGRKTVTAIDLSQNSCYDPACTQGGSRAQRLGRL